jgi:hypothetical protein
LRREAVVGNIGGERAHRIAVYPFVRLATAPPSGDIVVNGAVREVERGERGCTSFTFELTGQLPHPARPQYNVRAMLDSVLDGDRRFVGAVFTLDGRSIGVPSSTAPVPAWNSGQALSLGELLGTHEMCVQLGKAREGGNPVPIPVHFSLVEQPWEAHAIIGSFTAIARIATPGWLERWGAALTIGILGLILFALLWYGRYRPYVAQDLRVAVGPAEAAMEPRALGSGSLLKVLAGSTVWRPVRADPDVLLGWIRPQSDELYDFRAGSGITVEGLGNHVSGPLTVRQPYVARAANGVTYWFCVEYE